MLTAIADTQGEQRQRETVADLPDRIIAATGLFYSVPVISRDSRIRSSNIQTVW